MRYVFLVLACTLAAFSSGYGQSACRSSLRGAVNDKHDGKPLLGTTLYLVGAETGTSTAEDGTFVLTGICAGHDTLRVTHIGCEPAWVPVFFEQASAKTLVVELEHHTELLDGIEVHAHRNQTAVSDVGAMLSGEQLDRTAGADFADVLEALPGVRQLKNGANTGRPLVDGLGGSRLVVIQGGMPLATQDWGDEHALEIDPFATANLQLARTGSAVRYGFSNTGATLLLDDPRIPTEKTLEGQALLLGSTNDEGFGGGLSVAKRIKKSWGFRATASGSTTGDARAPDYVLSNTASRRLSGLGRLYYAHEDVKFDLGYRGFFQSAGILRAAHIGNLTDLRRALEEEEPLVIRPFTRAIEAPRQASTHHWLSANLAYALARKSAVRLSYSFQLNSRQEYDIRRGGRSAIPSLDLELTTHDIRTEYEHPRWGRWQGTLGLHAQTASNRNDPRTGTRDFIPFYDGQSTSLFVDERWVGERWTVETAGRIDGRNMVAQWIERGPDGESLLREWSQTDLTGSLSLGIARFMENGSSLRARLAYGSRTPNPAERFANSIHHALAVLEYGDTTLHVEHGLKLLLGLGQEIEDKYTIHVSGFVQVFDGFIYQQAGEPELTVRGAFPVFTYEQGDAFLAGVDLDAHVPIGPLQLDVASNFVYGRLAGGEPLPDIAPLRTQAELSYSVANQGVLKDWRLAANLTHVIRQNRVPTILPAPSPEGFALVGLALSGHVAVGSQTLGVHFTAQNLLDVAYRDYLDRLRFYADRPGRDLQLRLLYDF